MKKKSLILISTAFSFFIGNIFAQNVDNTAVAKTIGNTAKDVSRFSFGIKGGIDYLPTSDQKVQPEAGAFLEISINPLWGIGAEYMYLMNNRKATVFSNGYELESTVQDVTLYGSVNLSNILAKYRSHGWQKWNVYANLGGGISIYDWKLKDTDEKDNGIKPVALAGLGLEYNAAKWLALGLDGQYRFHTNEEFIGDNGGRSGRSMLGANLSIRFKFGGNSNVRNMTLVDYEPQVKVTRKDAAANANKRRFARLTSKLDGPKADIKELESQLEEIQKSLDSLKIMMESVEYYQVPTIAPAVFRLEFESGKDVIKPSFYPYLDEVVGLLKQYPEYSVVLRGYADSSGNAERNLQLSKKRANTVKNYLLKKGVSESVIGVVGYGIVNPIAPNTTPAGRAKNRRVEIELY